MEEEAKKKGCKAKEFNSICPLGRFFATTGHSVDIWNISPRWLYLPVVNNQLIDPYIIRCVGVAYYNSVGLTCA